MHVVPQLIVDGQDLSRYFISAHCEQTANAAKDPNKYDIVLANTGGKLTGLFAPRSIEEQMAEELGEWDLDKEHLGDLAPKSRVSLKVTTRRAKCVTGRGSYTVTYPMPKWQPGDPKVVEVLMFDPDRTEYEEIVTTIFYGEIQKVEVDELFCRIEGSCSQGGMTSRMEPRVWDKGTPIVTIVNDLLDMFGGIPQSKRHIFPAKNSTDDVNPDLRNYIDFDTAFFEVAAWAESIYFFDENDDFWFCPATDLRGFSVIKNNLLRSSNASNMVGYCNWVEVYGGSPDEEVTERKTHNAVYAFAKAPDIEMKSYGVMKAPAVTIPNANYKRCQEVADKLLEWYRQYKDVPTIKIIGRAPGLLSKVAYWPWNASMPPIKCESANENIKIGPAMGLVTRRIVDISAETGFVCTLDVTTNFLGVNKPTGDEDVMNFYNLNRDRINADPDVLNKFPGVVFAQ